MSSGLFEYKSGNIYYEVAGEGEVILFVHGFTLDHTMWVEQVKYFSTKYNVLTVDLRGFGKSSLPKNRYSYSDDINALLDHLAIEKCHIVGLSLGGEEALNFALDFPERILSLTLVSSSMGGYASKVDWDVKAETDGLEKAKNNWLNHDVFSSTKHYPSVASKLKVIVENYSGWHWLNSGYRIRPMIPATERLAMVKVSTLIVVGEMDLPYYHEIAKILNEKIVDSRLEVIKNSGHMLTMEQADLFNQILESFLSGSK